MSWKSIELSPNFSRKASGPGSLSVAGCSRAAASDPHRQAKAHPPVAISPVRHRRIDEFRVWHNYHDVVVRANHRAACANSFHLTGDSRHLDTISDRDRSLGQNDQTADEIAGDVLQTETDAHAHGTGEHRQRPEMDAGIVQNDHDP